MAIAINDMGKQTINVSYFPEDTSSRVEIFILENKYKEAKRKDTTF